MSFFVISLAVIITAILFLTYLILITKNKLKITKQELRQSQREMVTLEKMLANYASAEEAGVSDPERFQALLQNATQNQKGTTRRVKWGPEFDNIYALVRSFDQKKTVDPNTNPEG